MLPQDDDSSDDDNSDVDEKKAFGDDDIDDYPAMGRRHDKKKANKKKRAVACMAIVKYILFAAQWCVLDLPFVCVCVRPCVSVKQCELFTRGSCLTWCHSWPSMRGGLSAFVSSLAY